MKKTLLGTTALVSVGLLSGQALASDPLKVTVGGSVVTGFYAIDADDFGGTSFQNTKVPLVARNIDINAEGTLDNGLVAGVNAKLMLGSDWNTVNNAINQSDATFRQLFAYLEGGFGRIEFGGTNGAAYKMHYTSPWFVPGNGVDSPNIYNHGLSPTKVSTFSLLAADSNKVSYFTPRLAGFQLGVSYTPDVANGSFVNNGPKANGFGLLPGGVVVEDVFEVALNYAGTFGAVDVGLDGFYTKGSAPSGNAADPEEYGFGANIGTAGFTLGGAYYESKDTLGLGSAGVNTGSQVWTAGLKYGTGPWTVGVAYLAAEGTGVIVDNDNKSWQFGGGYNLGAGVDVGLDLQLNKVERAGIGSFDAKSAGFILAIAF